MSINAIIIDDREPQWVRDLKFNDLPVTVATLKMGDVHALTGDGCLLVIERKTPDDYLNSLKEGRLMIQVVEMAEKRVSEDLNAERMTTWPYLLITGEFRLGPNGKVVTKRDTHWDWNAVMGSLLTIQEAGVFVHFCSSGEFESAILRLGERKRDRLFPILPPRKATPLGPGAAILAAMPGIGSERVMELLKWSGGNVSRALAGITDMAIDCPLPNGTRRRIRKTLGLRDAETMSNIINTSNLEIMEVSENV